MMGCRYRVGEITDKHVPIGMVVKGVWPVKEIKKWLWCTLIIIGFDVTLWKL